MRISYELASLSLTFFTCFLCVSHASSVCHFFFFFAMLLLIVANINTCTFSCDASTKFGLRFTIAKICLSLNLSKVISFSILLYQFRIFLIVLHNSINTAFSGIWSSNADLHFLISKISCIQSCFTFWVTPNVSF